MLLHNWQIIYQKHLSSLSFSYDNFNIDEIEKYYQLIYDCSGKIIFTGIGKSWHIAEKIAATYRSINIESVFVDPINSLHGDMAVFKPEDVLFVFSKSGETKEIIYLLSHIKNKLPNIILCTSNKQCTLTGYVSDILYIPVDQEADHLNKVPSTSSIIYLTLFQSLGLAVALKKGLTIEDFGKNHPGGSLGTECNK